MNQPMKQVLQKTDIAGRMVQWEIELSEFDLKYEARTAIKAQCLTDFLAEYTGDQEKKSTTWELYVDGSSNKVGSGVGIILVSEGGTQIEVSLKFEFPASNNQAEYEALIAGLKLAEEVGATKVRIFSDPQVVTSQINGEYQAKDPNMKKYLNKTLEYLRHFKETEVKHITRDLNSRADALSKLASTKSGGNNRSLIQKTLPEPFVDKTEAVQDVFEITGLDLGWMKPLIEFLKFDILPKEEKEAKKIRREAQNYTLLKNILYKREISAPLLKCVPTSKTIEVLEEVHNEICGNHLGARSLARKWIEAEPLATITAQRSRKFLYKNIITRYGVPHSITTDNDTQFTDSTFKNLVASMKIKHQFTSVEHPQANGQAEVANKVILAGLKKRL
ncbi:uncharacterized protein LOC130933916 [Arachis stenosperma]|uniref:uncharacterized protein LOC130933916 n=1 Tax=Arachis stenosperma TaxID=217475 RepID=UPI0025AC6620|nr:uncharacterized protein LOC130933916 [Arachis stenosperma]